MDPKLTHLFCSLQIEPRSRLCADVCREIVKREQRSRYIKLSSYSLVAVISLGAIVPASMSLVHQLGQSSFGQYASLAISDSGALSGYWKQFAVTLIESVPGISLAIVLAIILILGWSARNAIQQVKPQAIYSRLT